LEGKNLFKLICLYSKFKLNNIYGDEFFEFRNPETRERIFDYTIDVGSNERVPHTNLTDNEDIQEAIDRFTEVFNSFKTLVSQTSLLLFQDTRITTKKDNGQTSCGILLKTKIAPIRENFDECAYRELFNC
jgi:hypothetical protein